MSLLDRIRDAWDVIRAPRPVATGPMAPAAAGGLYRMGHPPVRGSRELAELYREAPWLRAVAHKISSSFASVPWRLYVQRAPEGSGAKYVRCRYAQFAAARERREFIKRGLETGDLVEIEQHPFLDLWDRPNAVLTGRAARQVSQVHVDIQGETFWLLEENAYGMPVRAWPMPSHWVTTTPTDDRDYYEISWPGGGYARIPVSQMLVVRDPDPADPYGRGAGIGAALRDELDADEFAAKHVAAWFHNKAMPDMIVSLEGARQETVERAKRQWEKKLRGFERQYQTHFTGAKIDVQRLDTSFKDMALVELRRQERDVIIQTFGIPPELIGIIENSNRATIDAAEFLFARHALEPRLELWRSELQVRLIPRFDDRLILEYDSPVPADREFQLKAMIAMPAAYSIDEHRELAGVGPLDEGRGLGHLTTQGAQYVSDITELQAGNIFAYHLAAGIPTVNEVRAQLGLPPRAGGDEPTVAFNMGDGSGGLPGEIGLAADPAWAKELARAREVRRIAEREIERERQAATQRRDLTDDQVGKLLAAVDPDALGSELEPLIRQLIEEWGEQTIKTIDDKLSFDPNDPEVQAHVREFLNDRIGRLINTTTREALREALDEVKAEDEKEIRRRIREVFREADIERSDAIAQTEALRTSQFATQRAFEQTGIELRREWISTRDGRAREEHLAMDGQLRKLTEPFEVPSGKHKGAKAMTPGSFGIAALDIGCRCVVGAVLPDDDDDEERTVFGGGVVARGITKADEDEREAVWKAVDEKLQPWDAKLARAVSRGFAEQERRVLAALEDL